MTNLKERGLEPLVVFDGDKSGAKAETHYKRESQRKETVTSEILYAVIKAIRKCGLYNLISPYEADHQLVYLCQKHCIKYVITIDSDFLFHPHVKVIMVENYSTGNAILFDLVNSKKKRS